MKKIILPIFVLIFSSCAYMYQPIKMETVNFAEQTDTNLKIAIQYSTDDLFENSTNKRLYKKSIRKNTQPLVIKVVNNTEKEVYFDSLNIEIFMNYSKTQMLSNKEFYKTLKQKSSLYSLYLLGNSLAFGLSSNGVVFNIYPLILFSTISVANISLATISNQKIKQDISKYSLQNKVIPPNSEVYGLVFIKTDSINNVLIRYKYDK